MSRELESENQQILEKAYGGEDVPEAAPQNPTVLSCGGIFIPQPRRTNGKDPYFHILNTANEENPAKVVSVSMPKNMLQIIIAKENLN